MEGDTLRSQAHVEYLIMTAIGVLVALVAVSGLYIVAQAIKGELEDAYVLKETILEGLT